MREHVRLLGYLGLIPVCALCEQGPALTALPLLLECTMRKQAGQPGHPPPPSLLYAML